MAIQLGALRDALLEAGASPEAAGKAAEELAAYQGEFHKLESSIEDLRLALLDFRAEAKGQYGKIDGQFIKVDGEFVKIRGETKAEFERVWGELNLHRWMLASIFALLMAVAIKIFLK